MTKTTVVLLVLCLFAFVARMSSRYADCVRRNGVKHKDGSIFTNEDEGKCYRYKCYRGNSIKIFSGCEINSTSCVEVGKTWTSSSCLTYKCTVQRRSDGTTKNIGEIFQYGCKDSRGVCHNVGTNWTVKCVTYSCSARVEGDKLYLSIDIVDYGCQISDKVCHPSGSTWDVNCATYKCFTNATNNESFTSSRVVSTTCRDANGVCRQPGETFPLVINGNPYENCGCSVNGNSVSYTCAHT